jgi:hypothetical protein
MQIDRRELMTGFAISAAATLPAFPATAAVRRVYFENSPIIDGYWPRNKTGRSAVKIHLESLWHYDRGINFNFVVRHVPSGLTFQHVPERDGGTDDMALRAAYIDTPFEKVPSGKEIRRIGWAARATVMDACLRVGRHRRAIFIRYTLDDPLHPYNSSHTEDAPPLSPFSSSGPPRGHRTALSSVAA